MGRAGRKLMRLAAVGLCFALAACGGKPSAPPPGGTTGGKAERARREAEALAVAAVDGAATAQARARPDLAVKRGWFGGWVVVGADKRVSLGTPKPVPPKGGTPPPPTPSLPEPAAVAAKEPPVPQSRPRPGTGALVVRERVVGEYPCTTEAEAEEEALRAACGTVERKLAALDPPVRRGVSPNEVRTEFLRADSRSVRPLSAGEEKEYALSGLTGKLVYVEYDVEVTAEQVRELRTQERVAAGVRLLGVLTAVALAGFLFLRADEWTRGYLTSWLALGAVALAGGAAAALIFV